MTKCYGALLSQSPNEPLFHRELASAYSGLGDREKALEHYHRAIELDSRNPANHGSLGWHHYLFGEYQESIQASQQALALDPDQVWIQYNLALALLCHGDQEDARAAYKRAMEISKFKGEFEDAIVNLEAIVGKITGAEEMLDMVQEGARKV